MSLFAGQVDLPTFVAEQAGFEGMWVFHHIPKTAGSSLAAELASLAAPYRNLSPTYTDTSRSYDAAFEAMFAEFLDSLTKNSYRSVSGHLLASHLDRILDTTGDVRFFTFLRNPVDRIVSEYNYCRTPAHPPHEEFSERFPTLLDFVRDPRESDKLSRQYLFNEVPATADDAVAMMASRYVFVGTQERYPASFLLLSAMLGQPALPRQRVRVATQPREPLPADLRSEILARNQMDMAIYRHFDAALADVSDSVWTHLMPSRPEQRVQ